MIKSTIGLDENIAALLAYLLGWISGLVFFVIEKQSDFVRFHAAQSIVTFGGLMCMSIVAPVIPFIGGLLSLLLAGASFGLWLYLMIMAFQGRRLELPLAGELARKLMR
jgi:uncharacterized membrane protein